MTTVTIPQSNLEALTELVDHFEDRAGFFAGCIQDYDRSGQSGMAALFRGKAEAYETAHDLLVEALRLKA